MGAAVEAWRTAGALPALVSRHLPEARANTARNGYRGARCPKMIADDAQDIPSPIAVLLV